MEKCLFIDYNVINETHSMKFYGEILYKQWQKDRPVLSNKDLILISSVICSGLQHNISSHRILFQPTIFEIRKMSCHQWFLNINVDSNITVPNVIIHPPEKKFEPPDKVC